MNAFIPRPAREYTDEEVIAAILREESALTRANATKLAAAGKSLQAAIDEATKAASSGDLVRAALHAHNAALIGGAA